MYKLNKVGWVLKRNLICEQSDFSVFTLHKHAPLTLWHSSQVLERNFGDIQWVIHLKAIYIKYDILYSELLGVFFFLTEIHMSASPDLCLYYINNPLMFAF